MKKQTELVMRIGNDNSPNRTHLNFNTSSDQKRSSSLAVTSLIGYQVENTHGERLGSIKNVMINVYSGRIEYVIKPMADSSV